MSRSLIELGHREQRSSISVMEKGCVGVLLDQSSEFRKREIILAAAQQNGDLSSGAYQTGFRLFLLLGNLCPAKKRETKRILDLLIQWTAF